MTVLQYCTWENFGGENGKFGESVVKFYPPEMLYLIYLVNHQVCTTTSIFCTKMAGLFKYFHHTDCKGSDMKECLPDPDGELSKTVLSSPIALTNTIFNKALEKPHGKHRI